MKVEGGGVPAGTILTADVCIVGAGPAGLTIARELMSSGLDVCVLESGASGADPAGAASLRLEPTDTELAPQDATRARGLGGTANIWNSYVRRQTAFRTVRLSPLDFEHRPAIPNSGWPFSYEDLVPYYERAESMLQVRHDTASAGYGFDFDPAIITHIFDCLGRAAFFTTHLPGLLTAATNTRLITSATAVEVLTEASGAATGVVVSNGKTRFQVNARLIVLAGGAIDTARLLLSSTASNPAGLGNTYDVVGRYYLDHHNVIVGTLHPAQAGLFDDVRLHAYDSRFDDGVHRIGRFTLSEDLRRQRDLLHGAFQPWPQPNEAFGARIGAANAVLGGLLRRRFGTTLLGDGASMVAGARFLATDALRLGFLDDVLRKSGGWSTIRHKARVLDRIDVIEQTEIAPRPENRLTLGTESDHFGVRRARVEMRWSEADVESVRSAQAIIKDQFESRGIGRFEPAWGEYDRPLLLYEGGAHHMAGTTRMNPSPKYGAVDSDSRLHECPNIYVAGASVFPTAGYANPTMTILALALRLADHLKRLKHE
ncbi:MAG TPA: GMC family oxidoreductase [Dehalococcoidia bacterium]|nr:GMC family oxidoreductase [Dehalococcoidia bacterium]